MGEDVDFGEKEAAGVEALYTTDAARRRREFVRDHLDPRPGESVLSIGCGPGFEPAELAAEVTPDGRIHAVDTSEPMLALAERRCDGDDHVTIEYGDATDLPAEDDSFDAVAAVQVHEYVEDLDAALSELERVLRPGGRAAVYATDWDTLVWNAADRDRTSRVASAWLDHCAHPHLGSSLRSRVGTTSLTVDRIEPFAIVETALTDTFAGHMRAIIRSYATEHEGVESETARAWGEDLRDRDEAGETTFGLTAFLYLLSKPE